MIGVRYPFTISGGSVATTSNPAEIIQGQIAFCMSTSVGERVMRSDWGINLLNSLYAIGGDLPSVIEEAAHEAFRRWFPDLQLKAVEVSKNLQDPTKVTVDLRYKRLDSDLDSTLKIGTPIPGGAEMFDNEGF